MLDLVQIHYHDFGPILAHEKLTELHAISVGVETLRQWMISDGLWLPHAKNFAIAETAFGELIQIDGSHHDWFEGRSDKCCLIVYIDDATSQPRLITWP